MLEKILGLDLGISSIGWAVVEYDKELSKKEDFSSNKIIKSGVRIFTAAENPKTGESLALPRRLCRGARRMTKRKSQRIHAIKKLCLKYLVLSENDLFSQDNIFKEKNLKDVWLLRAKALRRALEAKEFVRVLIHIAKRRGYKSNRKVDEVENSEDKEYKKLDKEKGKVLNAIRENEKLLTSYLTIGEAIYENTKKNKIRRNKKDDYKYSISRAMLENEVKTIFKKQREFLNSSATKEFEQEYLDTFLKQRDFASVDKMVGFCTLEKKPNKRAPKASYLAQEFVTLTKLINTKIIDKDGLERSFTKKELELALNLCKQSKKPSYLKLKKELQLAEEEYFKGIVFYEIDKSTGEFTKKATTFKSAFKDFHKLRKALTENCGKDIWNIISKDTTLLDKLGEIFSYHKSDTKIKVELEKLDFKGLKQDEKSNVIEVLISNISFAKNLHLSLKALAKIVPLMKEAKRYDEAIAELGYKKETLENKSKFLRGLNKDENFELTNSVVKRAIAQSRKVINALIRTYGSFDKIHIELTRDIKKSHKDRNKIQKAQEEYQKVKSGIAVEFKQDFGREPNEKELLKFRLWKEQGGYCAYRGYQGAKGYLEPSLIIKDENYAQIDHILPFSKSLDDSMLNKVLCFSGENQNKRNNTPYEYFMSSDSKKQDWDKYEIFIKSLKGLKQGKKNRLLKKNFDENSQKEFRARNANDTAFMSRFIKDFIEENLLLTSKDTNKVLSRNGMLTNLLRHSWHIGKKDRKNHLHHAADAIIIAFATQSEVQRLSTVSAKVEGFSYTSVEKKDKKTNFNPPMKDFRDIVSKSLDDIFVSFSPRKKITGEAHEQTIFSPKDLSANKKQEKPSLLSGGSVLRNIKLNHNTKLAKQSLMPRIDIFRHKTKMKYYVVPIYTYNFVENSLPNKAIVSGKNKDGTPKPWLEMDEEYEFIFSVFKNELLEVKTKKELIRGYFVLADSATSSIKLKSHDNKEHDIFKRDSSKLCIKSIGLQNANHIKKFQVDALGNISEIKEEKRVGTRKELKKERIKKEDRKKVKRA